MRFLFGMCELAIAERRHIFASPNGSNIPPIMYPLSPNHLPIQLAFITVRCGRSFQKTTLLEIKISRREKERHRATRETSKFTAPISDASRREWGTRVDIAVRHDRR